MKNIIKTKYKVGDKVCWINYCNGNRFSYSIVTTLVKTITITLTEKEREVLYLTSSGNKVDEEKIFGSIRKAEEKAIAKMMAMKMKAPEEEEEEDDDEEEEDDDDEERVHNNINCNDR